jgi:hypothetical protein
MTIDHNARVAVFAEDNAEPDTTCTIAELIAANEFDEDEVADLLTDLAEHGEHRVGGGAAVMFTMRLV